MKRLTYRDEEGTPHWSKELMEDDTGWAGELIRSAVADMEDAAEKPRLDRSAWEPCDFCGKELDDYPYIVAHNDYDESNTCYTPAFCPVCGRPLDDAAWEMLEKRLEGRE